MPPSATVSPFSALIQIGPLLLLGALYARRVHSISVRGRRTHAARQASFYTGLAVIGASLTVLDAPSQERLYLHMVEHLILADVASLLLVLGLTGPVIAPLLRTSPFNRLRGLMHPLVALALWALALCVWHLPALYEAALRSPGVHALQHMSFLGAGLCVWMALLGPLPKPVWFGNVARFIYIVAISLPGVVIGYSLLYSGVLYPYYRHGDLAHGVSPLADQHTAGALMMTEDTILVVALLAWLLIRAVREGEERERLMRLADRLGVEVTEERIDRAVAAGRGADLGRRLRRAAAPQA